MNIQEFTQNTIPDSRKPNEDLTDYLSRIFDKYCQNVKKLDTSTDPVLQEVYSQIDAIEQQAQQIIAAIQEYLSGNHLNAQIELCLSGRAA